MNIKAELYGFDTTIEALKRLPNEFKPTALLRILSKSMQPAVAVMKQAAPVAGRDIKRRVGKGSKDNYILKSGTLQRSISVIVAKRPAPYTVWAGTGPKRNKDRARDPWYAYLTWTAPQLKTKYNWMAGAWKKVESDLENNIRKEAEKLVAKWEKENKP